MLRQTMAEAVGNLAASRQRSVLALLGIFIGAGAVIAMLNVGAIARHETVQQFQDMGTDILTIRASQPQGLSLGDVEALPQAVPGLAVVAPFTTGNATAVFGETAQSASAVGVTGAFGAIAHLHLREGRFISDFDRYELYCVVGSNLAETLSSPVDRLRVGSELRVGRYVLRVVGILQASVQGPMMPVEVDNAVFVSIPNGRRLVSASSVSTIIARMLPGVDAKREMTQITDYFAGRMGPGAVDVQSAQQLINGMAKQMRLFEMLLGAVGGIALVLGGVGVMNIMLVSVQERHREIGIRLAIGARRRDIQMLFLSEAVILAVLGGLLGILLGFGASYAFARVSNWQFLISPTAAPIGAGVSIVVGIFFGCYPAVMASRLDPIEALRSE